MKILSSEQIKACDAFTIKSEPVSSVDLMERAANACTRSIIKRDPVDADFVIFCGKGNNGGDGLAIVRLLLKRGFNAKVYILEHAKKGSEDFDTNLERLKEFKPECINYIRKSEDIDFIQMEKDSIIIDAIFGTGLNKKINGLSADVVNFINASGKYIFSIDIPSGLKADEGNEDSDVIVRSSMTLTFQFPKLSFLMAQNQDYVPFFEILDIGLSKEFIGSTKASYYYITKSDLRPLLKHRKRFSHKGNFGHALLVAGAYGKMGAALMAAKACLKSGAGLLTIHTAQKGIDVLQSSLPEAMCSADLNAEIITDIPKLDKFNAVAVGPGIGVDHDTETVIKKLLQYSSQSLVIDADALNILAQNPTWLTFLPPSTILTPHVKEFDRLTQKHTDDFDRMKTAKNLSMKHNCIVVLKSAYTQIVMPDGNAFFNSTGNAGLAKGGSGDTLTGIILGLLARGYNAPQSALLAVYLHGSAADACLKKINIESLLATDVINKIPKAFDKLYGD
jgi:ADP-dependent NAD(P)H-hydrate dehydratase / NAD(P)H-hydrate epimerase